MADRAAQKKMVEANLRSVTQSCKGGVPMDRLERDYRDLLGTSIPYRELGFSSLEAMIRGMPDIVKIIRNEMGKFTVMGVADDSTAHIASLVARQRPTKARKISSAKPRFRPSGFRGGHSRQPFSNYSRNRFQIQSSSRSVQQNKTQSFFQLQSAKSTAPWPQHSSSNRAEAEVKQNRPEVEVKQNKPDWHMPLHSASSKPEIKIERGLEKSVPPTSKRQSPPPVPKANFEVPPRFLRQQLNLDPISRRRPVVKKPLPLSSPVENHATSKFSPVDNATPIPPPTQSNHMKFLSSEGSGEILPKIPSPKPKQTKERRKLELPTPPLPNEGPPIEFVKEYARANGLDCKFITLQAGQKQKYYISILHLGDKKYRSYPESESCLTTKQAEELAASQAMKAILEEEQKPKFAAATIESAEQIHKFVNRVEEIVAEKPNGIWEMKLPREYEDKFSESLPTDWLSLLQQNVPINIDIKFFPISKAHVLCYAGDSGAATPSSTSSKTSSHFNEETINETSIENFLDKSLSLPLSNVPPPLILPEDELWDVLVTFVSSTKNIAVRLIDQDDYLNAMSAGMKEFYKTQYLSVEKPIIGRLYAAHQIIDGQHCYYRVRVDDLNTQEKEAICYYVDIGESQSLSYIELYDLDRQFENLPFQAIHMSLDKLEDYDRLVKFSHLDDKLLGKPLIAEIKNRSENQIVAVFYDTSGPEDLNLNDNLLELIIEESLTTSLPEIGSTRICFLTHATIEGEVYLRCSNPSSCLLEDEMDKNFLNFENALPISRSELSSDNIYVTKYDDGNWYRVMFWPTSEVDDDEVELFFVDYGNSSFCPWSHIKDLGSISKFLSSLPFQAKPCTLLGVPPPNVYWTENGLRKLYELVPENQEFIVKVANPETETSPPVVMLFSRNEQSVFISINEILLCSNDLFSLQTVNGAIASFPSAKPNSLPIHSDYENHVYDAENIPMQSYANNCVTSPSVLWAPTPDAGNDPIDLADDSPPPPEIPEIDHLFDVHITYVASPSNFVIQSLKSANALNSLLEDMQAFYKTEDNLCDMHLCLLKPESYYAALHKDGLWYRVKVKNIDEGEQVMVAVHFIDYGDFDTVNLSNLQPLYQQFKALPCQAIKASLHGVKPIFSDWLAEQCFEVKELINERQFVSVIKSKKRNAVDEFGEWTLSIHLIDVSSPEQDIHIHRLLIERGLAAPAL